LYNNIDKKIRMIVSAALLLWCFMPLLGHSAETESNTNTNADTSADTNSTDEFCVVEKFKYFVDWVEKELKHIDDAYFAPKPTEASETAELVTVKKPVAEPEVAEEEIIKPLNLSLPEVEYGGSMALDKGQKTNFPNMFSGDVEPALIKEETGASFGGRILMDDAELEGMQEYRLNTVRDAIRGAEFSLEFKTN